MLLSSIVAQLVTGGTGAAVHWITVNHASAREKRSTGAVIHLSLILEHQPWCSVVGGISPHRKRRGVIESSLSSPAELPRKSTKWGQTAESFQRLRTLCSNNLYNWLNCRLQLVLNTGHSLQNHFMSSESLEMSQNKTDFFYSFIDTLNLLSDLEPICSEGWHGKQTFSFRANVSFNIETNPVESRGLQSEAWSTMVGLYFIIRWMRIWLTGSALNVPRCKTLDRVPEIFAL